MLRYYLSTIFVFAFVTIGMAALAADDAGFRDYFLMPNDKRWYVSDGWANGDYQSCEWRASSVRVAARDLRLTLNDHGGKQRPIGCPELHTNARLSYGLYEARMRTAAGPGLNTAFFTYIGPPNGVKEWDEIDFEFLGKDPHTVSITQWANGTARDGKVVQLGFDASQGFHNYAFDWEKDKVTWYVDGKVVAETAAGSPVPRNPGMLFFSLWSGSASKDDWLGHFDYKAPVTADVEWAAYTPTGKKCAFPESLSCKK